MTKPFAHIPATDADPASMTVVVAMSGGVDSSVTAALLKAQGYNVVGLTMRLYDSAIEVVRTGTCCAGKDIRDAQNVAEKIGIKHEVVSYENTFERDVIVPFADSYANGETPIPCVVCNQTVKFRDLIQAAKDLGADALATGHYAQRVMGADGAELWRGKDHTRDQTYFLCLTTKEQLDFLRFPLGGISSKDETRRMAEDMGLTVHDKPDSQDICFVPHGKYAKVVKSYRRDAFKEGDIVDQDGTVLARHNGLIHYTIGQRKGLGIGGLQDPLYVIALDAENNRVVVGPKEALGAIEVAVRDVNWLGAGDAPPADGLAVQARMRSLHEPVPATVYGLGEGRAKVVLDEPFHGVAPGQACVFYDGERCLGGGWISKG